MTGIGCSYDGAVSATWKHPDDGRAVTIKFKNNKKMEFFYQDEDGNYCDVTNKGNASLDEVKDELLNNNIFTKV